MALGAPALGAPQGALDGAARAVGAPPRGPGASGTPLTPLGASRCAAAVVNAAILEEEAAASAPASPAAAAAAQPLARAAAAFYSMTSGGGVDAHDAAAGNFFDVTSGGGGGSGGAATLGAPQGALDGAARAVGAPARGPGSSGTPLTPLGASQCAALLVNELKREEAAAAAAAAASAGAAASAAASPAGPRRLFDPLAAPAPARPCWATAAGDAAARPFYGLIVDGVHVHPYAVSLAWETHPAGLVLVTDAMSALGLAPGRHELGGQSVDVFDAADESGPFRGRHHAVLAGAQTLAGAVAPLPECVNNFLAFTGAPLRAALDAVTRHPAAALGLGASVGTLRVGAWADLVLLRTRHADGAANAHARRAYADVDAIDVLQTWVGGVLGFTRGE